MKTLLSLGHGYSCAALAARLLPLGWRVIGTTLSASNLDRLRASGVEPLLWPCDLVPALAQASHILASAAPDGSGDPFLHAALPLIRAARPEWVGYLSTTAVYGDHQGAWVDEDTPVTPQSARAVARVLAERQWLATGLPVHIFRLAGIYGPGRGPFEKVRDGSARRIIKPGQVFSRVHVDDITSGVVAALVRNAPAGAYNLGDNLPASGNDVTEHACRLLGLEPPPLESLEDANLSEMARGFYAENRRVANGKAKRVLGWTPRYATYVEGLAALL